MEQIAKQSNLTPVSFDTSAIRITNGQKALLKLLKDRLEEKKPITKEDILDFYITNIKGSETYNDYGRRRVYNNDTGHFYTTTDYENVIIKKWRDVYPIKDIASNWFTRNLGSCILKGKLLAIPVIEI